MQVSRQRVAFVKRLRDVYQSVDPKLGVDLHVLERVFYERPFLPRFFYRPKTLKESLAHRDTANAKSVRCSQLRVQFFHFFLFVPRNRKDNRMF